MNLLHRITVFEKLIQIINEITKNNPEKYVPSITHTGTLLLFNCCLFLQNVPYADAMNKTLVFAIFDFDRFSKHDQIGEVKLPLCQVDLAQTIEDWRELQSVEGEGGQVRRSFRYYNVNH
jgi:hypothetical protein